MAVNPTQEQEAARQIFVEGRDLALVAGAGTGKTSTLQLMAESTTRSGIYVAFNKSIAVEAARRFGPNVKCSTAHALAYRAVGDAYRERLRNQQRVPARRTAQLLGIRRDLRIGSHPVTVNHQARLVMGMVRRFCYSTDRQVMSRHMELVNGLSGPQRDELARELLPYAQRAWEDVRSTSGRLRFEHDHYLKMWALRGPRLLGDFIMLDEAQDTNPVLEEVFLNQDAQRICVGDPAQQIYAWRNARDVMSGFPAESLRLTESFRFGPQIAHEANRWLRYAESPMRLTGRGPAASRICEILRPDVVLCRGNADAMREVMDFLDHGVPVALTGGGDAIKRVAEAAGELKSGKRTSHPELFLFASWGEVQDYVENDQAGQDLKAIVKLVDKHGPEKLIKAVDLLATEETAHVSVSTAHKAKGREWDRVRIGPGFDAPPVTEDGVQAALHPAEARLIYVAVTRARLEVDLRGLSWIDKYEKAISGAALPLASLSLTGQLRHDESPVARFMARHLPNTLTLHQDCQRHLAGLPHPIQPVDVQYPDWSGLGHTVDYRLRLSFGGTLGPAVAAGVQLLAEPGRIAVGPGRKAVVSAGQVLLATVDRYLENPTLMTDEAMTRMCYVAAAFESVYRTGQLRRNSLLAAADVETTLGTLMTAVPDYVVEDIRAQMKLADRALRDFRALPSGASVCGPVFTGSADVPADADLILNGLLMDCKSTKDPRRIGREELYQLAGYLLLDYDDQYHIKHVGLYFSRQGGLITWPVSEFLQKLNTKAPLSLLRKQFRTELRAELKAQGMLSRP
ncbi:UvrD-helicase domain-containing protein [Actinokineospora sp. 24-640]